MGPFVNDLGQRVGFPLPNWVVPPTPPREPMQGRYCRLEPLDLDRHAEALFEGHAVDADGRSWTYLAYGPFPDFSSYRAWLSANGLRDAPLFFAVVDADGRAAGLVSYVPFPGWINEWALILFIVVPLGWAVTGRLPGPAVSLTVPTEGGKRWGGVLARACMWLFPALYGLLFCLGGRGDAGSGIRVFGSEELFALLCLPFYAVPGLGLSALAAYVVHDLIRGLRSRAA